MNYPKEEVYEPLPEDGPLITQPKLLSASLEDVVQNNYRQNKAINSIQRVVGTVAEKVESHDKIVNELQNIRKFMAKVWNIILWIIGFLGLGGVASLLNWMVYWSHKS